MTTTTSAAGRFIWHDLMTTDFDRAVNFYGELLDWEFVNVPVDGWDYTKIVTQGREIGGLVPLDESHGIASHWMGYVSVPDVDRAVNVTRELGGEVGVEPRDIPEVGRFAVIAGPGGAVVSPFSRIEPDPPRDAAPVQGTICWDQLLAMNPEQVAPFLEKVFGWTSIVKDLGEMGRYWVFQENGRDVAGMMPLPPGEEGQRDMWLSYVEVADVDDKAKQVEKLGGVVLVPPSDIPNVGRFSVTADPSGALIALSNQV